MRNACACDPNSYMYKHKERGKGEERERETERERERERDRERQREGLPSVLLSPLEIPSFSLFSSPLTIGTASRLKGNTPDFRNSPQTFDGDIALSRTT